MDRNKHKEIPVFEDHERFLKFIRVDQLTECWNWIGTSYRGYPQFTKGPHGKTIHYRAHRVSFTLFKKPIEPGLVIDHVCKNTLCVNPDHLREVTNYVNVTENTNSHLMLAKAKTHCLRGHEFNLENTHVHKGHRRCKECARIRRAGTSEKTNTPIN